MEKYDHLEVIKEVITIAELVRSPALGNKDWNEQTLSNGPAVFGKIRSACQTRAAQAVIALLITQSINVTCPVLRGYSRKTFKT